MEKIAKKLSHFKLKYFKQFTKIITLCLNHQRDSSNQGFY